MTQVGLRSEQCSVTFLSSVRVAWRAVGGGAEELMSLVCLVLAHREEGEPCGLVWDAIVHTQSTGSYADHKRAVVIAQN